MVGQAVRRQAATFLIVCGAVILIGALGLVARQPRYLARAEVIVEFGGAPPSAGAGDRFLDVQESFVRSRDAARRVAVALGGGSAATDAAVDRLVARVSAERIARSYSLEIGYADSDPRRAATIANSYAALLERSAARLPESAEGATPPRIRTITDAEPPLAADRWPLLRDAALLLFLGAVLGVVGSLVADRRRTGVTGGRDVTERLGLLHIGDVPLLASVLPAARSPLDAVLDEPMSGFAEAFRSIGTSAAHASGSEAQAIAVASALPCEGRSTIAACLAGNIAASGMQVVLVDCDTRRRGAGSLLAPGWNGPGLAEVLRGQCSLDDALVRDDATGAWVLPPGEDLPAAVELQSGPSPAWLEALRARFARIVIDTAPILSSAHSPALLAPADAVVLAIWWGTTPVDAVTRAIDRLAAERVQVAGALLNRVDLRKRGQGRGDQSYYYQQVSKYYS